jgi:hypothetical protein
MQNSEYLDKLAKEVVEELISTTIPELAKRESGCYSSIEILMYLMRNFEQTVTLHLATSMYEDTHKAKKEESLNRRGRVLEQELTRSADLILRSITLQNER